MAPYEDIARKGPIMVSDTPQWFPHFFFFFCLMNHFRLKKIIENPKQLFMYMDIAINIYIIKN